MTTVKRKRRRGSSDPLPEPRRGVRYFVEALEHLHIRLRLENGGLKVEGDHLSDVIRFAIAQRAGAIRTILQERIDAENEIVFGDEEEYNGNG